MALLIAALTCGVSAQAGGNKVLIIQDERPQMDVLAKFLEEKGKLSVTIADQQSFDKKLSPYKAVVVFIHKDLHEQTERVIIDYTQASGRLVCLHHSISSKKAENKFYFDFLGVQLNKGPMEEGGYAYKASSWTFVNLNSKHYITNHKIDWNDEVTYTCSDQPGVEKLYPCTRFKEDSEVFVNHRFTDGRDKTVLCGLIYTNKATGKTYMQDRAGWIKSQGKGTIVYLMPGHCVSDYQNERIAQMVLNAVTWE
ncbi:MAG: hypothetical protein A2Z25_22245 [Planctomycetes bacterium RBG_16_55_9]|nr:MAG: hypothetical protein A2Z25_22245 [Planctomycetes bacterium RBG_16_55_9]